MFIVCRDTILNRGILDTSSLPRRFLGRVMVLPRREASPGVWLRLIAEMQLLRYVVALVPFVVAMFIWPDLAFPLAQAPLAMLIVIAFVEIKLLRLSDAARTALMDEAEADRIHDSLTFRARALLRDIAAPRGLDSGALLLVVEQSDLARVPPLTLVSVQAESPRPHLLDLSLAERQAISAGLFSGPLTEAALHRANLRRNQFLRSMRFEARAVSAHARLAARLAARADMPARAGT